MNTTAHLHCLAALIITANTDFFSAEINRNLESDMSYNQAVPREHGGSTALRNLRGDGVFMAVDLLWAVCWRVLRVSTRPCL